MEDHTTLTRPCKRCGKPYPRTKEYFSPAKSCKDGLRLVCRRCMSDADMVNYYGNREARLEQVRQYREENLERVQENDRARYWKMPHRRVKSEKQKASSKAWHHVHPNAGTPEAKRAKTARRRARKRNAEGKFTRQDIEQIMVGQNGNCWWCGTPLNGVYEIDHRIPLSRGGTNYPENLCLTCMSCNRSKSDKLPQEWNGRLL